MSDKSAPAPVAGVAPHLLLRAGTMTMWKLVICEARTRGVGIGMRGSDIRMRGSRRDIGGAAVAVAQGGVAGSYMDRRGGYGENGRGSGWRRTGARDPCVGGGGGVCLPLAVGGCHLRFH